MSSSDVKPDGAAGSDEMIMITLKDHDDKTTHFRIKRTTRLAKVFQAYAQRQGVDIAQYRFLLDGDRLAPDQTPESAGMEDGDQVDVMAMQEGGF
mmetsp:Transcript_10789/g.34329  ORF Transcript_10789/g.34329 Transcript_10789/m.34329 type:complete len:95 (+) Transcript_10789:85-369(+)